MKKGILFLIICALILGGCSIRIEKRHYRKGFFIQKRTYFNANKTAPNYTEDLSTRTDSVTTLESSTDLTHPPALFDQKTNILAESDTPVIDNQPVIDKRKKCISEKSPPRITPFKPLTEERFSFINKPGSSNKKLMNQDDSINSGVVILGIVLLIILSLIVFVVFAVALAYGGFNWISLSLGLLLILLILLIVYLALRL